MSEKDMKIIESQKKSTLGAKGRFDYEKLVYNMPCFLPCTYEEQIEEVIFTYDIAGMKPVKEIKYEEKQVQYQFLINLKNIEPLFNTYKILLIGDNLYYDENYMPFIKQRDLYGKDESREAGKFLFEYKTFIGGILGKKYNVKTLQESGLDLLKPESTFKEFYEAENTGELVDELRKRKNAYEQKIQTTTVRVKKSTKLAKTITVVVTSTLFIGAAAYLGYLTLNTVPAQERVIVAHERYVANEYVDCIDAMRDVEPSDMDISTKYILAVSYGKGERSKQEELEDMVSRLSLNSNEKELDYWIHLGRTETQGAQEAQLAQELAKSLSDDQLLMYAYMKEHRYLKGNTSIAGEEKEGRISELDQNINAMGEKYTIEDETK